MLEDSLATLMREIREPRHGIYGPSSVSWQLAGDVAVFIGGGRAALLQLAHPFVAYAIAEHSRTRSDVESTSSTTLVASIVASHAVTSISRLCPALAAAPVRVVLTESLPFSGPRVWIDMRGAY